MADVPPPPPSLPTTSTSNNSEADNKKTDLASALAQALNKRNGKVSLQ